jgi:alkylation response protein AidB-like acyl-CoA dehydrogenase
VVTVVAWACVRACVGREAEAQRYDQYGEAVSFVDNSLSTLIGAQFVLFCGSILQLGTAFHHTTFLPRASTMALRGCFAMTGPRPLNCR